MDGIQQSVGRDQQNYSHGLPQPGYESVRQDSLYSQMIDLARAGNDAMRDVDAVLGK
jgi:hypothetical protein